MSRLAELEDLKPQITKLLAELRKRAEQSRKNNRYYEGCPPFPKAVVTAKMTKAYQVLMPMAEAPWGSLVVDSVQDRLEVAGIRSDDKDAADRLWHVWQANGMDAESKLGHNAALINGRAFATVWPGDDGQPEIVLDSAEQMIVQYREGSRRHRVAALRYWEDDSDRKHCTLYRPDGLYKFREAKEKVEDLDRIQADGTWWEQRVEKTSAGDDEDWPVENSSNVVPVVEVAVNRRLKPGSFGYARGEFEHCTGLLDRINLLTFLGLVVALWMGFPLRGVIGDKILKDDEDNPLPPFDPKPDSVVQFEDPQTKTFEFKAADRKNLSIFAELSQLAYVTKTPAHYFPLETGISNISDATLAGLEGGMHAKVTGHKASVGEGWEEVNRVAGLMLEPQVILPPNAELVWKDHHSRSMAERADAATKVKELLPWQLIAERYLNFTQDEITRAEAQRAGSALNTLIAAA